MDDAREKGYGLRAGAEEFPLMVVLSIIYPCNLGCPNCPYTDGNSEIRRFYRDRHGELFPMELWRKIADECGAYGAWMRCTGGGEPMLHAQMVDMIEYAKAKGARVWLNTNGSMFGPTLKLRRKLERIMAVGIDLIEFSMDAADAETYAKVRPPHGGPPRDPQQWWRNHLDNVRAALQFRKQFHSPSRVVVSIIRQEDIEGKLDAAVEFWLKEVGVDDVVTRKFLTWDDNTAISSARISTPTFLPAVRSRVSGPLSVSTWIRSGASLCAVRISLSAHPTSSLTFGKSQLRKFGKARCSIGIAKCILKAAVRSAGHAMAARLGLQEFEIGNMAG